MHPMDEHVVDTMIHDVLYLDKVDDVVASLLLPLTPATCPFPAAGSVPTVDPWTSPRTSKSS